MRSSSRWKNPVIYTYSSILWKRALQRYGIWTVPQMGNRYIENELLRAKKKKHVKNSNGTQVSINFNFQNREKKGPCAMASTSASPYTSERMCTVNHHHVYSSSKYQLLHLVLQSNYNINFHHPVQKSRNQSKAINGPKQNLHGERKAQNWRQTKRS